MTINKAYENILKALQQAKNTAKGDIKKNISSLLTQTNNLKNPTKEGLENLIKESVINRTFKGSLNNILKKISVKCPTYNKNRSGTRCNKTIHKKDDSGYNYSKLIAQLDIEIENHTSKTPNATNLLERLKNENDLLPQNVKSLLGNTAFPSGVKQNLQKLVPKK